jgi:hypothetical protein
MSDRTRPIVYISYSWMNTRGEDGRPGRAPDPRGRQLADRFREAGLDARLDMYFLNSEHGFKPPELSRDDPRDPWYVWSSEQIANADAVVMLCVPGYAASRGAYPGDWHGWSQLDERTRVQSDKDPERRAPALWWDWFAMASESPARPDKFIPVGYGPYHRDLAPEFVEGASYNDLSTGAGFDALVRRIRRVYRLQHPREGVFVSYAHKDNSKWLDMLMTQLVWLKQRHNINIWTDRDIPAGTIWHDTIQTALQRAKVGVLMVSPQFFASEYITKEELARILEAVESDGLTIFWIPVIPYKYSETPINKFQAAHPPDKPLSTLKVAERDQALVKISEKLAQALNIASR